MSPALLPQAGLLHITQGGFGFVVFMWVFFF